MKQGLFLCHGYKYTPPEALLPQHHYSDRVPRYQLPNDMEWRTLDINPKTDPSIVGSMWDTLPKFDYIVSMFCPLNDKYKAISFPIVISESVNPGGSFYYAWGLSHFFRYAHNDIRQVSEMYNEVLDGRYPSIIRTINMVKELGQYSEVELYDNGLLFKKS